MAGKTLSCLDPAKSLNSRVSVIGEKKLSFFAGPSPPRPENTLSMRDIRDAVINSLKNK